MNKFGWMDGWMDIYMYVYAYMYTHFFRYTGIHVRHASHEERQRE